MGKSGIYFVTGVTCSPPVFVQPEFHPLRDDAAGLWPELQSQNRNWQKKGGPLTLVRSHTTPKKSVTSPSR